MDGQPIVLGPPEVLSSVEESQSARASKYIASNSRGLVVRTWWVSDDVLSNRFLQFRHP